MLIGHFVLLAKNLLFNLLVPILNCDLFTTFLNPIVENSLSTYSNSLSKVALNFFNDSGKWPSQGRTLMSKIRKIKVLTTSSHEFFQSHCPWMSPPTHILVWWGYCPFDSFASLFASSSFLDVFQTILTSLSNFIGCVIPLCIDGVCYIDGSLVGPINQPTLFVRICIHGPTYQGVLVGYAITIIGCCTHPGGGCHCRCPSTHYCITSCYITFCCIISTLEVARWSICNNFLFLFNFVVNKPATSCITTTLKALCIDSLSSSSSTWYSNHVTKEN